MADVDLLIVVWLVTWLLHSTLLYGGAWLIDRLRLLRSPAAREHLWRGAMVGALLTATLQTTGVVERVPLGGLFAAPAASVQPAALAAAPTPESAPVPAAVPGEAAADGTSPDFDFALRMSVTQSSASPEPSALPAASLTESPAVAASRPLLDRLRAWVARSWVDTLMMLWVVGAGLGSLRLLALGWLARRELADREPAQGALLSEFAALCGRLAVRRPALCVAPALAGPISLPNGEIAVPPWAAEMPDSRQRQALLAHELAHQVRRDPQWLAFALGLHALLWLQPLHALARRRLAALAELQADAWAARAVNDPRALAECLAECAERLTEDLSDRRVALFGAAMTKDSLLVERVDRLLEGIAMRAQTTSWMVRGGVLAALVAAAFTFPGCDVHSMHMTNGSNSINVSSSGGDDMSVKVWRSGYELAMQTDGVATFTDDESDIATLAPGCTFELDETLDGVQHVYTVKADGSGALTRSLKRDGVDVPLDGPGKQWLAGALPRMFRESGYDAEARVARLMAQGGPARVLAEVDQTNTDYAKATYLGELLGSTQLDGEQTALALASAMKISSSYELHCALSRAMQTQSIDAPRFALLLEAARQIDSDYEQAEVLVEATKLMPDDDAVRAAWVTAAGELDSDYELGRTIEAGLSRAKVDEKFVVQLIALAEKSMDSDYELHMTLERAAPRAGDAAVAAAYLAAARSIDSSYERHTALVTLLDATQLDTTNLGTMLDVTASIDSNYEKCQVLKALAIRVVANAELSRRYRDIASTLDSYERGEALTALDQAERN